MKRTIEEVANSTQQNGTIYYDQNAKRLKLESQKIGDFIVNALDAIHFRFAGDEQFFGPKFAHQIFGEKEQIRGYEGLSVDITLSPKFLVPLIQVSYEKKAPIFAISPDNVEEKLKDYYGKIYTDP